MRTTLGIDFGTNSVRSLIVDCATGRELASSTSDYPSGTQGILLDPGDHHLARQSPSDYLLGLERSVEAALKRAASKEFGPACIVGIGVTSTGSSPLPVDYKNHALAQDPAWSDHLAAQCWLWKDHTSHREAVQITNLADKHRPQYIAKCGGTYSSEWFWAKIWRCLNDSPNVFHAAYSWVELADWIPSILGGVTCPLAIKRGVCMAGHKAMYAEEWGGLPDQDFLALLDPQLAALRERLYHRAFDATECAGRLSPEWGRRLGLSPGLPIAIGEMDVHYGAIGCGVNEGTLVKVVGTSACDCVVVSEDNPVADIPGICGIVKGAILPGYYGIEAGQSAVGDIFKWWVEGVCQGDAGLHQELSREAETLRPGQSGLIALDWNNGNRTVLIDSLLSGLLIGQTLYTTRAEIYRALIEATAFGARTIIERLRIHGVPVDQIVCAGGIAEKNSLAMQIYADVIGCSISIAGSSQACALGAAMSASVQAGVHQNFEAAQAAMTSLRPGAYVPDPQRQKTYNELYALYRQLHDAFGGVSDEISLSKLMKVLIALKEGSNDTIA